MKNLIITCHVEPLQKKTDISYLDKFFFDIGKINIPIIYLLMYGERAENRILKRFCHGSFGLHIHNHETKKALDSFKKYFGYYPKDVSFGHWEVDAESLKIAQQVGVKSDYSYSAHKNNEKYFCKKPFKTQGLNEYPTSCDPVYPLTPITLWKHFFIMLLLFVWSSLNKNLFVHFSFHSYDLHNNRFNFLRWKILCFLIKA